MKHVILIYLTLLLSTLCLANPVQRIERQLSRHVAEDAVDVHELALAVYNVSTQYKVSASDVVKIIVVESRGRESAYNKRTQDYGLMQVNKKTASAYGFSERCLKNWRCNLEAGIAILADIKDRRVCRYNVGTGRLEDALLDKCLLYERKLASID